MGRKGSLMIISFQVKENVHINENDKPYSTLRVSWSSDPAKPRSITQQSKCSSPGLPHPNLHEYPQKRAESSTLLRSVRTGGRDTSDNHLT